MEASLGAKGSRFFASPIITKIGWFSILIALGGEALSNLAPLSNFFSITIFGVLVASVTYFGFSYLSNFTKFTALVTGAFALWATYSILINNSTQPKALTGDFTYALSLAIGGAMSISTVSPDFVKGASSIKDLRITSFIIVLPVVVFSLISGSIIGNYSLIPNPVQALTVIGLPIVANLLLLWGSTAAASSLYPPSIALSTLTRINRNKATVLAAFLGLVIANIGILEQLRTFLQLIGILLPPLIGINIAEYYVISKRLVPKQGVYVKGTISFIVGAILGVIIPVGIAPLNSLLASFVVYLLLHFKSSSFSCLFLRMI